jgi:hypothetical protein
LKATPSTNEIYLRHKPNMVASRKAGAVLTVEMQLIYELILESKP